MRSIITGVLFATLTVACAHTSVERSVTWSRLQSSQTPRRINWPAPGGKSETIEFVEIEIPAPERAFVLEYLNRLYGTRASDEWLWVAPRLIVLHSMAEGNLERSLERSGFLDKEVSGPPAKWGRMPLGAHFIVDRDGTIYCLSAPRDQRGHISYAPGARFATRRHVVEANPWALGIENIVPEVRGDWTRLSPAEKARVFSDLTPQQADANARLSRWLMHVAPTIKTIHSHDEFAQPGFVHQLSAEVPVLPVDAARTTERYDTGAAFLGAVKAGALER